MYFARRSPTTSSAPVQAIFFSRFENGRWSVAEIAPFSGSWPDFAPAISPDGSRLFFASLRPRAGDPPSARPDADIWFVERTASGWSEPSNVGAPVNSDRNESSPSIAADGTLYFASDRDGGAGSFDIWKAEAKEGGYGPPEPLGAAVNSAAYESQPSISADQSLLVFTSVGRPEISMTGGAVYPRADLYASRRLDGAWQPARNLGPAVNTTASETSPSLAPDGKRLFFTSERGFTRIPMPKGLTREGFDESVRGILNGRGNIYEIGLDRIGLTAASAAGREPSR